MDSWQTWDTVAWQAWAMTNWWLVAIIGAGLLLLLALLARTPRTPRTPHLRHGESMGTMPEHGPQHGVGHGQVIPDRRADILAAIDHDYAAGRIDRVEWERRRREF